MPRKTSSDPTEGFSYLDEDLYDGKLRLVNWDALDGAMAKNIGVIRRNAKVGRHTFYEDTSYVLIVADLKFSRAAKDTVPVFSVVVFDDEGPSYALLYKNIPDIKTAEMLAESTWKSLNHYAGRVDLTLLAAVEKYRA